MEDIEIVRLSPDEWQAYRELRLEALKTDPQAFGSSYLPNLAKPDAEWKQRLQDVQDSRGGWLLFARQEGALVGMAGAFVEEDPEKATIISVYVTPAKRGLGISKLLMERLWEELRATGRFKKLLLWVNPAQTAALRLYERMGFERVGVAENVMLGDGLYYDEWIMERSIEA